MKTVGIVAEYNPFHTGHAYQIARTKAALGEDCAVAAVMSGNWVQQGDCAVADKWTRARLALMGGVDLVLELPTPWATASAESFARGAVELLAATGVVDVLSFGSECGDLDALREVAACLDSDLYAAGLRRFLDEGMTFAACRQAVTEVLLGREKGALLASPNNNLGIEYLRALRRLGSPITPFTVRREGAGHGATCPAQTPGPDGDCAPPPPRFLSATHIRLRLAEGRGEEIAPFLPTGGLEVLRQGTMGGPPALARVERAILARLRAMTAGDWAALPDSGAAEGLPGRLARAGGQAVSLAEFFDLAKTKRYTRARLARLVLWAWLGLTAADVPERPLYLRVLGASAAGRALLKDMKQTAALPVITKPAHVRALDDACQALFALEARCTDLYGLLLPQVPAGGREWTVPPVLL